MARRELDLKNAPWRDRRPDNQFYGYYISFESTGCEPVDEVLRAVACAAQNYHSTEYWRDADHESHSHLDWVQFAAQSAADEVEHFRVENAALSERVAVLERVRVAAENLDPADGSEDLSEALAAAAERQQETDR